MRCRRGAARRRAVGPSRGQLGTDRDGERDGVARCHHRVDAEQAEGLAEPAGSRANDRRPAGERLEDDKAEPLQRDARHDGHVGGPVPVDEGVVVDRATEPHRRRDAEVHGEGPECRTVLAVAHEHELVVGTWPEALPGPKEHVEAHAWHEPPHRQDHAARPRADARAGVGAVTGDEPLEVHAGRDDLDRPGGDAIARLEQLREGGREHDEARRPTVRQPLDDALDGDVRAPRAAVRALIGPWALEVHDHRGAPQRPDVQGDGRGAGEVDVGDVGRTESGDRACHPPRGASQPARRVDRDARPSRRVHAALAGPEDHGVDVDAERPLGGDQVLEVAVQPAGASGRRLEPDLEDPHLAAARSAP